MAAGSSRRPASSATGSKGTPAWFTLLSRRNPVEFGDAEGPSALAPPYLPNTRAHKKSEINRQSCINQLRTGLSVTKQEVFLKQIRKLGFLSGRISNNLTPFGLESE